MPYRIGHGQDVHRIQNGGSLKLGGVVVSNELSAVAHSDGDVVLHALVDALFGALGLGDIGDRFSNSDPQWKDCESRKFVEAAMGDVRWRKMRVINIDISINAEKPMLKTLKPKIAESVRLLTDAECVNVKAGTNEGLDAVGRGEAIAATVVVLLAPEG
ncbi:MAG: 2-C-methyl-D-erythritol 2,4-cyclodiphosphate synthase [Tepidisphaeraceae bacterium]